MSAIRRGQESIPSHHVSEHLLCAKQICQALYQESPTNPCWVSLFLSTGKVGWEELSPCLAQGEAKGCRSLRALESCCGRAQGPSEIFYRLKQVGRQLQLTDQIQLPVCFCLFVCFLGSFVFCFRFFVTSLLEYNCFTMVC